MSTALATKTAIVAREVPDQFFRALASASQRALLLDYDGTIAPLQVNRNRACPYPTVPELLDCITSTCNTRVVLISGRAARDIPPLLDLNPFPEIWGTYGRERLLPDGTYEMAPVGREATMALIKAEAWLEREGLQDICELKPGAVAVHWRGLERSQVVEVRTKAYRALALIAGHHGLVLSEFSGGLELRVENPNKGDVVRAILADSPPSIPTAFLGDDAADEDAFQALRGRGLTVLVRPTYRFSAAQVWLKPPGELIQFLTDWIRSCGGDM